MKHEWFKPTYSSGWQQCRWCGRTRSIATEGMECARRPEDERPSEIIIREDRDAWDQR